MKSLWVLWLVVALTCGKPIDEAASAAAISEASAGTLGGIEPAAPTKVLIIKEIIITQEVVPASSVASEAGATGTGASAAFAAAESAIGQDGSESAATAAASAGGHGGKESSAAAEAAAVSKVGSGFPEAYKKHEFRTTHESPVHPAAGASAAFAAAESAIGQDGSESAATAAASAIGHGGKQSSAAAEAAAVSKVGSGGPKAHKKHEFGTTHESPGHPAAGTSAAFAAAESAIGQDGSESAATAAASAIGHGGKQSSAAAEAAAVSKVGSGGPKAHKKHEFGTTHESLIHPAAGASAAFAAAESAIGQDGSESAATAAASPIGYGGKESSAAAEAAAVSKVGSGGPKAHKKHEFGTTHESPVHPAAGASSAFAAAESAIGQDGSESAATAAASAIGHGGKQSSAAAEAAAVSKVGSGGPKAHKKHEFGTTHESPVHPAARASAAFATAESAIGKDGSESVAKAAASAIGNGGKQSSAAAEAAAVSKVGSGGPIAHKKHEFGTTHESPVHPAAGASAAFAAAESAIGQDGSESAATAAASAIGHGGKQSSAAAEAAAVSKVGSGFPEAHKKHEFGTTHESPVHPAAGASAAFAAADSAIGQDGSESAATAAASAIGHGGKQSSAAAEAAAVSKVGSGVPEAHKKHEFGTTHESPVHPAAGASAAFAATESAIGKDGSESIAKAAASAIGHGEKQSSAAAEAAAVSKVGSGGPEAHKKHEFGTTHESPVHPAAGASAAFAAAESAIGQDGSESAATAAASAIGYGGKQSSAAAEAAAVSKVGSGGPKAHKKHEFGTTHESLIHPAAGASAAFAAAESAIGQDGSESAATAAASPIRYGGKKSSAAAEAAAVSKVGSGGPKAHKKHEFGTTHESPVHPAAGASSAFAAAESAIGQDGSESAATAAASAIGHGGKQSSAAAEAVAVSKVGSGGPKAHKKHEFGKTHESPVHPAAGASAAFATAESAIGKDGSESVAKAAASAIGNGGKQSSASAEAAAVSKVGSGGPIAHIKYEFGTTHESPGHPAAGASAAFAAAESAIGQDGSESAATAAASAIGHGGKQSSAAAEAAAVSKVGSGFPGAHKKHEFGTTHESPVHPAAGASAAFATAESAIGKDGSESVAKAAASAIGIGGKESSAAAEAAAVSKVGSGGPKAGVPVGVPAHKKYAPSVASAAAAASSSSGPVDIASKHHTCLINEHQHHGNHHCSGGPKAHKKHEFGTMHETPVHPAAEASAAFTAAESAIGQDGSESAATAAASAIGHGGKQSSAAAEAAAVSKVGSGVPEAHKKHEFGTTHESPVHPAAGASAAFATAESAIGKDGSESVAKAAASAIGNGGKQSSAAAEAAAVSKVGSGGPIAHKKHEFGTTHESPGHPAAGASAAFAAAESAIGQDGSESAATAAASAIGHGGKQSSAAAEAAAVSKVGSGGPKAHKKHEFGTTHESPVHPAAGASAAFAAAESAIGQDGSESAATAAASAIGHGGKQSSAAAEAAAVSKVGSGFPGAHKKHEFGTTHESPVHPAAGASAAFAAAESAIGKDGSESVAKAAASAIGNGGKESSAAAEAAAVSKVGSGGPIAHKKHEFGTTHESPVHPAAGASAAFAAAESAIGQDGSESAATAAASAIGHGGKQSSAAAEAAAVSKVGSGGPKAGAPVGALAHKNHEFGTTHESPVHPAVGASAASAAAESAIGQDGSESAATAAASAIGNGGKGSSAAAEAAAVSKVGSGGPIAHIKHEFGTTHESPGHPAAGASAAFAAAESAIGQDGSESVAKAAASAIGNGGKESSASAEAAAVSKVGSGGPIAHIKYEFGTTHESPGHPAAGASAAFAAAESAIGQDGSESAATAAASAIGHGGKQSSAAAEAAAVSKVGSGGPKAGAPVGALAHKNHEFGTTHESPVHPAVGASAASAAAESAIGHDGSESAATAAASAIGNSGKDSSAAAEAAAVSKVGSGGPKAGVPVGVPAHKKHAPSVASAAAAASSSSGPVDIASKHHTCPIHEHQHHGHHHCSGGPKAHKKHEFGTTHESPVHPAVGASVASAAAESVIGQDGSESAATAAASAIGNGGKESSAAAEAAAVSKVGSGDPKAGVPVGVPAHKKHAPSVASAAAAASSSSGPVDIASKHHTCPIHEHQHHGHHHCSGGPKAHKKHEFGTTHESPVHSAAGASAASAAAESAIGQDGSESAATAAASASGHGGKESSAAAEAAAVSKVGSGGLKAHKKHEFGTTHESPVHPAVGASAASAAAESAIGQDGSESAATAAASAIGNGGKESSAAAEAAAVSKVGSEGPKARVPVGVPAHKKHAPSVASAAAAASSSSEPVDIASKHHTCPIHEHQHHGHHHCSGGLKAHKKHEFGTTHESPVHSAAGASAASAAAESAIGQDGSESAATAAASASGHGGKESSAAAEAAAVSKVGSGVPEAHKKHEFGTTHESPVHPAVGASAASAAAESVIGQDGSESAATAAASAIGNGGKESSAAAEAAAVSKVGSGGPKAGVPVGVPAHKKHAPSVASAAAAASSSSGPVDIASKHHTCPIHEHQHHGHHHCSGGPKAHKKHEFGTTHESPVHSAAGASAASAAAESAIGKDGSESVAKAAASAIGNGGKQSSAAAEAAAVSKVGSGGPKAHKKHEFGTTHESPVHPAAGASAAFAAAESAIGQDGSESQHIAAREATPMWMAKGY